MQVLYEDNHIIIVSKEAGEIVQGDKTGDQPLSEKVKAYIKERYAKPGAVFLGVVHRLDRPVSGIVVFARTSKALERLNRMFANHEVVKVYHALLPRTALLPADGTPLTLTHYLTRNTQQNKSYAHSHEVPQSKKAVLDVRLLSQGTRYQLAEINLHTGRHHQIRCQLAQAGAPIRGDLKYGAPRSNPDGSISLHARSISFVHPVSQKPLKVEAPYPASESLWDKL